MKHYAPNRCLNINMANYKCAIGHWGGECRDVTPSGGSGCVNQELKVLYDKNGGRGVNQELKTLKKRGGGGRVGGCEPRIEGIVQFKKGRARMGVFGGVNQRGLGVGVGDVNQELKVVYNKKIRGGPGH